MFNLNLNGKVKIGAVLVVLAFVVLISGGLAQQGIGSSLQNTTVSANFIIPPNGFYSYRLQLENYSYIILFAKFSSPVNIYFVNASAFSKWISSNGIRTANGMKMMLSNANNGLFVAYMNQTEISVPPGIAASNASAVYTSNTQLFTKGTYYLVADNTNGSASSGIQVNGALAYLPPISNQTVATGPYSQLKGQIYQSIAIGLIFFILLFAGIILMIYGIVRKPRLVNGAEVTAMTSKETGEKSGATPTKEEIDRLYRGIGGKRAGRKKNTNGKMKGKAVKHKPAG